MSEDSTSEAQAMEQLLEKSFGLCGFLRPGGELQSTRFSLFDTKADLGLIYEIAEGDPLLPDHSGLENLRKTR